MAHDNQVNTLRELTYAVHAFDRALVEAGAAIMGRPFNDDEIEALLKVVRNNDPRSVDRSVLQRVLSNI